MAKAIPAEEMIGRRYERLIVIRFIERRKVGTGRTARNYFLCRCDCGNETEVSDNSLRTGNARSCSCIQKEKASQRFYIHGHTRVDGNGNCSTEYKTWQHIKHRCFNESCAEYRRYGGAGISMYGGWINDFPAFLAHIGPKPSPGMSIDRIDNSKGYFPGNIRWADDTTQANNKNNNVVLEQDGKRMTISEWARFLKVPYGRLISRYANGWTVEQILQRPHHTRIIEIDGQAKTISEWCSVYGRSSRAVRQRIHMYGWTPEDAIKTPPLKNGGKRWAK